ncbi:bone morphogenetic protein 3-like [Amphiura filiformis]|uniref:bone morphogenetic protein 3-like n=1 Tax=Amphiura filiformis TaxID=82378 RepID=UPI003B20D429
MSTDQELLQRRGNTVRSVVPTKDKTCGKDTFVFPLRTLEITEQLDSIEMHYFVRKLKRWSNDNLRLSVQVHHIDNESICNELGALQLPANIRGWQILNLTSYIERLLNETVSKVRIGITFSVTTDRIRRKMSEAALVRKILSKHVQPFMLVFTEDKSAREEDSQLSWQRLAKDLAGKSKIVPVNRRRARSISNMLMKNNTYSLNTNEFPEDYDITNIADATFPYFAEQNSQRRKARKKEKNKKKDKKKKGKKSKHGPLLDHHSGESEEDVTQNRNENTIHPSKVGLCQRQSMRVDFKTLGWDGYVIAPEGFDAYYCAGECPFPLAKELNPSNHAALQSVINALGAIPNIPAPCCVPEKMSSIMILFFDEDKNVLLKSYSNMQVDSCSCR